MATTPDSPRLEEATPAVNTPEIPETISPAHLASNPQDLAQAAMLAAVEADPNLERATVTLPTEALNWLRDEAGKRGISTGEMLRTAIGTQKYLTEKIADGAKVQVKDSTGVRDLSF